MSHATQDLLLLGFELRLREDALIEQILELPQRLVRVPLPLAPPGIGRSLVVQPAAALWPPLLFVTCAVVPKTAAL